MSINKKHEFSDELRAIGCKKKGTRGEAVKAIWAYANENELKETRRVKGKNTGGIKPDKLLSDVFGNKNWQSIGSVAKAVSSNIVGEA